MGLSHITMIVHDLDKTATMLTKILNAKEVYSSCDRTFSLSKEKFFLIDDVWVCIMEGNAFSERTYNHIAFKIAKSEYDRYIETIKELGLELRPPRPRVDGVGRSIYFYDYDNHLLELHTGTLDERLARYGITS